MKLVVALVIIGLALGPAALDPSTPEGTVQLYIQSVVEGDFDTASTFWADDGCTPTSEIPTGGTPDVSASLVGVDGNDIEASVTVRLTESSPDPLGGLGSLGHGVHLDAHPTPVAMAGVPVGLTYTAPSGAATSAS